MNRRTFLADCGMGFTGLALGATLGRADEGKAHFAPKAKSVIWLFMMGGASHLETFDRKPELEKYAGKTIAETPYADALARAKVRELQPGLSLSANSAPRLFPTQVGFRKYGASGIEVSDWLPHIGSCADELAVVRSLWTSDIGHGAQLQFHTGRHILDGAQPTLGSWVRYGLGSLNDNLPQFVVLGAPPHPAMGGDLSHGAHYLGPEYAGVPMKTDPQNPLPFSSPGPDTFREEQRGEFGLLGRLHRLSAIEYPEDAALRARIKAYELASQMQLSVPEVLELDRETEETRRLYGLDQATTRPFGEQCLAARRLVERGVRFIQIYHGGGSDPNGAWDSHGAIRKTHSAVCAQVDQPVAALLKDLRRRGLLDETIVVWGTEFGRSPGSKGDGREHHPSGFSAWLAGGGIKRGVVHGATDEIGYNATEHRHYVTDLHATVLHQLGLDPRRLERPGRKRLEVDFGTPIRDILA